MGFSRKKVRLLQFLTRRIPRFGWAQWVRGLGEREMSYLAMDLADILPADVATIVDVGAHTGLVADALDFLYRPLRVWVVEPNPQLGPRIEERLRGRPQFTLVPSCLGEQNGEVTFNIYDFDAAILALVSAEPGTCVPWAKRGKEGCHGSHDDARRPPAS